MRDYRLGFTRTVKTHEVKGGLFSPTVYLDETTIEYHAMEKGRRICPGDFGMNVYYDSKRGTQFDTYDNLHTQELAAPFNAARVTCKACLARMEEQRLPDLEREVERLWARVTELENPCSTTITIKGSAIDASKLDFSGASSTKAKKVGRRA